MKIITLTTLILLLAMASCDDSGKRAEALYSKAEASFMCNASSLQNKKSPWLISTA